MSNFQVTNSLELNGSIIFEGSSTDANQTTLSVVNPTGSRTVTIPDATGTLAILDATQTLTNKTISGANNTLSNIGNASLTNSTISGVALGSNLNTLTIGTGLSGTSYNGSSAVTVAIDSTVATLTGSQTLTNKTIALGSNTVSGTLTQFNTAVTDADFASLAGTETLTNKTINGSNNTISNIGNSSLTNSSVTVNGTAISLGGSATITAASPNALTIGTGLSGTSYNGSSAVTIAIDSTVATLSGSQTLTNKTIGSGTSLSANLAASNNKITGLGTPTDDADAATKAYVDAATAGLNVHDAVRAATTANIDLSTEVENGDTLDGVTLATGNRILVKNQTAKSENGVYVVAASGTPSRASDYDSAGEVDAGDFIFVQEGTTNGKTGWVQTNVISTVGTDNIEFTQFSGAGTYSAGNGLSLSGTAFSIDTAITVDLSTAQTLSNKTMESFKVLGDSFGFTGIYDSDGQGIISLGAYFSPVADAVNYIEILNSATTAAPSISAVGTDTNISLNLVAKGTGVIQAGGVEVATISGTQTLTNKTLTSPSISSLYISDSSIVFEGTTDNAYETTLQVTDPTDDRTITLPNASGTVALTSDIPSLTGYVTESGTQTLTNKTLTNAIITQAILTPTFTTNVYELVLGDQGDILLASNGATAGTINIPTNASVAFPTGTQITIVQTGSGQLTIQATTPATTTINSSGATATAPKLRVQNSAATLIKTNTDTWYVVGDIS